MKKLIIITIIGFTINSNAQSFSSYVWEQKDKAKADSIKAAKKADSNKSKPIIIEYQTVKRDTIPSKKN